VTGQRDEPRTPGGDLVEDMVGSRLADRLPGRVRIAEDGLGHQGRAERVDGQVQSAHDGADWHVQDPLGDAEHALDRRVTAAGDQHQPESAHVDDQCLLGDVADPGQHPGQRWQDRHARRDDLGTERRDDGRRADRADVAAHLSKRTAVPGGAKGHEVPLDPLR
jgi:hypothetical protein